MTSGALVGQFDRTQVPVLDSTEFRRVLLDRLAAGSRVVTFYGRPREQGQLVDIDTVLHGASGELELLCSTVDQERGYHELTTEAPALHCFERELHEQTGVRIAGHPWLKPVRRESACRYHVLEGKEVHEVAVGPIHAGVIEPGAFRFSCLGEQVHHLEIQLGYQHRGVEAELLARPPAALAPLVETIAGDSSTAHTWAYCAALERAAQVTLSLEHEVARAVALELERIGMHLATLSGLAADIGFLQGAAGYGRLRTLVINTTMALCGSRFGRGALRPGGVRMRMIQMVERLEQLQRDLAPLDARFLSAWTVRHRLRGVGILSTPQAAGLGVVGVVARASGIRVDVRDGARLGAYKLVPIQACVQQSGDCWGRAQARVDEVKASLAWLKTILPMCSTWEGRLMERTWSLKPDQLVVALVEGCRGEVVHCLSTDARGKLNFYKVQDPSLRNWMGLALAMRDQEISDFPICNKSFDLSYCGHDL